MLDVKFHRERHRARGDPCLEGPWRDGGLSIYVGLQAPVVGPGCEDSGGFFVLLEQHSCLVEYPCTKAERQDQEVLKKFVVQRSPVCRRAVAANDSG